MILKFRPYPVYRDSGIPWLGRVPKHWDVQRIKRIARLNPSKSEVPIALRKDQAVFLPMERIGTDGGFEASEVRPVSELWNGFTYFRKGDVIVAKITPCFENGKGACLDDLPTAIGFGSTELHVIRPSKAIVSAYLYRVTTLSEFRRLGADEMTGAAGQQRVPVEFISNFPIPVPSQKEQTAIVRFLDYVDRRILRVIRARQRRIKLLEEYKQALIHQAVTGQIDVRTGKPYPAYKDSGVEWLGQVPAHWEVVPLKRLACFKSGVGFPVRHQGEIDAEIPFFKVSDMNIKGNEKYLQIFTNTVSLTIARSLGATILPEGAIVFPKVGGALLTNKRRIIIKPCCVDNNIMACIPNNSNRDFLFLIMNWFDLGQIAKPGPVPAISEGEVRELHVALPLPEEQTAIIDYIDAQMAGIEAVVASSQREIELLREYRERLIADVVTGKVDVREVAAQLPEEPPEEIELMEEDELAESKEENKGEDDAITEEISEEDDR